MGKDKQKVAIMKHKKRSELEDIDDQEPLLEDTPPEGMVSVRFQCLTLKEACCACDSCACCPCCADTIYHHQYQIVVPENCSVLQFCQIASKHVSAADTYSICKLNGVYRLRMDDPIGPTIRSYEWIESPVLVLSVPQPDECCCCLMI